MFKTTIKSGEKKLFTIQGEGFWRKVLVSPKRRYLSQLLPHPLEPWTPTLEDPKWACRESNKLSRCGMDGRGPKEELHFWRIYLPFLIKEHPCQHVFEGLVHLWNPKQMGREFLQCSQNYEMKDLVWLLQRGMIQSILGSACQFQESWHFPHALVCLVIPEATLVFCMTLSKILAFL